MIFSNKKAAGESNLGKIIIVALLILILAYLLYYFYIENFVKKTITDCEGTYCKDTCDYASEFRDGTKKCTAAGKVCCKPIDPGTNPISVECKDKQAGDYCAGKWPSGKDVPKVCTEDLKCEELCVYCATRPTDSKCVITPNTILGKKVTQFTNDFECGCTQAQCNTIRGDTKTESTCIPSFCSSTTATSDSYMCCNI